MLKRESLYEKLWKQKLKGNLVPYLVAGKIVSIVIIIAGKYSNQVWGSRMLIKFLEKKICMFGKTLTEELLHTHNHASVKIVKVLR